MGVALAVVVVRGPHTLRSMYTSLQWQCTRSWASKKGVLAGSGISQEGEMLRCLVVLYTSYMPCHYVWATREDTEQRTAINLSLKYSNLKDPFHISTPAKLLLTMIVSLYTSLYLPYIDEGFAKRLHRYLAP